ncbi:type VII secretion protein EccB [Actinoplanes sp. NBRC 103695]|uniref:type VII secretion protein EccB n=1 Tax=Actinoplanes sp. NBRC 103695 TaxID=3032202 RepID=UPI0024A5EF0F|nr:type VII secretion protein EccB [Actinoplanes sp. NBRC 103695]GLZ00312.1 type VII secretion protein EccB [Actinoplanes sp. NBRC 103695]
MPSRQDQLHSYQYSLQRVVAALVTHDPDPHRSPLRRAGTTALVSLVIAALAVGAAAIYGLLTGNSTANMRDESVVYMEKGSGARYVYLGSDKLLHPVLNYASGLLIANGQAPKVVTASRERLASVPLGDPLGIPDAPDSLPVKKDLVGGDWTVCSTPPAAGSTITQPQSTLIIGARATGGTVLANPAAPSGLLVRDPAERTYLLFGNRRFQIPENRATASLRALGWNAQQPWPVAAAFINSVPVGPDLQAPAIDDLGERSGVESYQIGQLLTDGRQWSVAVNDGAAALTEVQARLLQADPQLPPPLELGTAFNNLKPSTVRFTDSEGLPGSVPKLSEPRERACMSLPVNKDSQAGLRIDATVPTGAPMRGATATPGGVQADFVYVPRGKGALVVAAASPNAPADSGTVSIVTDTATRYPIAGRELLGRLGYGAAAPQQVTGQMIALLPQGPSLDAARARQAATTG